MENTLNFAQIHKDIDSIDILFAESRYSRKLQDKVAKIEDKLRKGEYPDGVKNEAQGVISRLKSLAQRYDNAPDNAAREGVKKEIANYMKSSSTKATLSSIGMKSHALAKALAGVAAAGLGVTAAVILGTEGGAQAVGNIAQNLAAGNLQGAGSMTKALAGHMGSTVSGWGTTAANVAKGAWQGGANALG